MYLWSLLLIYVCMMHVCMMHIWYLVLDPGPWCLYIWCMYIWCMYVWCMYAWSLYDAQMYDTHISDPDPWSWYMHASMMHVSVMYACMYDPCMMHKCMIHIFLILIPDPYTWMYPWCIYLWCSIFCHERTNGPTDKAILGVGLCTCNFGGTCWCYCCIMSINAGFFIFGVPVYIGCHWQFKLTGCIIYYTTLQSMAVFQSIREIKLTKLSYCFG